MTYELPIQDRDTKLLALMQRCREVKLRLSLKKLQFRVREVKFHGHILSAEGLRADPEKISAVQDMPHPVDAKAVQRFIGFVTYLALISAPECTIHQTASCMLKLLRWLCFFCSFSPSSLYQQPRTQQAVPPGDKEEEQMLSIGDYVPE